MQQRYLGLFALAVAACASVVACASNEPGEVKSADQILAEQEALGDEQLKKERAAKDYTDTSGSSEEEKKREWDAKQADLELHRAAHSAETCPESVVEGDKNIDPKTGKPPKGSKPAPKSKDTKANATIVFANDGHVKSLTLSAPYDENPVGKCVQRALNAVIVPAYVGSEHTEEWVIDLTGGKKSGPAKTDAPKAE
ncbi:MAG TPA: hypothetical protein VGJ91_11985 [Polyangiaceae bacterium]|jgi:hypothetical protein